MANKRLQSDVLAFGSAAAEARRWGSRRTIQGPLGSRTVGVRSFIATLRDRWGQIFHCHIADP